MDGVEFLRRLMPQHPLPVVMLSAFTERGRQVTTDALGAGAVDFVAKPSGDVARGLGDVMQELRAKVKLAAGRDVSRWKELRPGPRGGEAPQARSAGKLIALGSSTGGTEALREVLEAMPAGSPGIVAVQHMPAGFTKAFAERLDRLCAVTVKEARTGDPIRDGEVLIAPGGVHTRVERHEGGYQVRCGGTERVSGHCPSVDVLMESVAEAAGPDAAGAILTGMGSDGARGLMAMRKAGARTVAQDEATSIVFGMPKAAFESGAAERLRPLAAIAPTLLGYLAGGAA